MALHEEETVDVCGVLAGSLLAVAADVAVCVRVGVGEDVGRYAEDGAVALVEGVHDGVGAAAEVGEGVREVEGGEETGAGVVPEGVQVEVVEGVEDEERYDLFVCLAGGSVLGGSRDGGLTTAINTTCRERKSKMVSILILRFSQANPEAC